jgi:hypothetical protein
MSPELATGPGGNRSLQFGHSKINRSWADRVVRRVPWFALVPSGLLLRLAELSSSDALVRSSKKCFLRHMSEIVCVYGSMNY